MKTIFTSKTAALALVTTLTGVGGTFIPEVNEWVAQNSAVILSILGVVSLGLRLITKDKVTLFPQ